MYNNIIQAPSFYRVGIYIRLSERDENKAYESDSESVINQRHLLMTYVNYLAKLKEMRDSINITLDIFKLK